MLLHLVILLTLILYSDSVLADQPNPISAQQTTQSDSTKRGMAQSKRSKPLRAMKRLRQYQVTPKFILRHREVLNLTASQKSLLDLLMKTAKATLGTLRNEKRKYEVSLETQIER